MLESGSSGSVRGVSSNGRPYREPRRIAEVDQTSASGGTTVVAPAQERAKSGHFAGAGQVAGKRFTQLSPDPGELKQPGKAAPIAPGEIAAREASRELSRRASLLQPVGHLGPIAARRSGRGRRRGRRTVRNPLVRVAHQSLELRR